MKTWKSKLNNKELRHIKATTGNSLLREFKANLAWHKQQRTEGEPEPCWECRMIASKLGIKEATK